MDAADPNVRIICDRVEDACRGLPVNSIDALLDEVDLVVRAETAKKAWNPKLRKARYGDVARSAVTATHLLNDLKAMFPPPWHGIAAPIGDLANVLKGFILGAILGAIPPVDTERRRARQAVKSYKARHGRHVSWELFCELVCLALQQRIGESTLRRYLARDKRAAVPGRAYLRRHWKSILQALSHIPPTDLQFRVDTSIRAQVRLYLQ